MELPVLDMQGETVGTLEVSDYLFGVPMNGPVVHQAMVRQRANARRGTSNTKTRAQVSGGGAKPRPQKSTGRARQGTIRAPHFRGGGVVFGPHPRSYRQRMPKKMRRLAIRCLLSDKVREERLAILQELHLPQAKTREMVRLLDTLKVSSSTLIVTPEAEQSVVLSAKNLPNVKTLPTSNLNVLDLLDHDRLIITVGGIRKAEEMWAPDGPGTEVKATPKATSRAAPRRRHPAKASAKASTKEETPAEEQPPEDQSGPEPAAEGAGAETDG